LNIKGALVMIAGQEKNQVAGRVSIYASLVVAAVMATAVPFKPAAAQNNDWDSGQWRNHSNGQQHYDRDWNRGGYGGGNHYQGQTRYYVSPRPYYYQPQPYYYQQQPSASFTVVLP
jgi:hypothetical protein